MNSAVKKILTPLASLRLTVVLLAISMLVILAGTLAQRFDGIWQVQEQYFHSLLAWIPFKLFLPAPADGKSFVGGSFPLLGGYTLIVLLLVNLLAAHTVRFKLNRKRIGVLLIHAGLIMLLVGELVTSFFAIESQMAIDEGTYATFSADNREAELAVVDPSSADRDHVVTIDESQLRPGKTVRHEKLPFDVQIDEYHPNSKLLDPEPASTGAIIRATAGSGRDHTLVGVPRFTGVEAQNVDIPGAYVTLTAGGKPLGTYLLSILANPQKVEVDGKAYQIALRFRRYYKPYTVHLLDFKHERHVASDMARNFASHIRLVDPTRNENREIEIKMNSPLRYAGETFFQASFLPGDKTTILQVVDNPGWLVPYIACLVGAVGMLIHFGMHLVAFLGRQLSGPPPLSTAAPVRNRGRGDQDRGSTSYALQPKRVWTSPAVMFPVGVTALCLLYVLALRPMKPVDGYDIGAFGRLPVTHEGRTQPLDSLARNTLKIISGRDALRVDEKKVPAVQWMLDVMARPQKGTEHKVFQIHHPDILTLLHLDETQKRFSLVEILSLGKDDELRRQRADLLQTQMQTAGIAVKEKTASLYQHKVHELGQHINLYIGLQQLSGLYLTPPFEKGQEWQPIGRALASNHPAAEAFVSVVSAYNEGKPAEFNTKVAEYQSMLDSKLGAGATTKPKFEALFNQFDPFYRCMILYVVVFLLACFSWLGWAKPLSRAALGVLIVTLGLHTLGLIARIYMSGRPPVTNLYSSAIFIAWGAVVLSVILEGIFRNGIGSVTAAVAGFLSLLIADRLSTDGDTMAQLQAVLDTNFWLATHVVVITLGYAATFLAGLLAIVYVISGLIVRSVTSEMGKTLARMVYGILCFALLFSFVGTILGGIWADQSWGRFWGWDPKENGAVLIVLWNALILHARWGGVARERGVMLLAIFGNVVTAWSWFGTNMLGIGLHAYGFMESAAFWLMLFAASQVALIALGGFIPLSLWRSSVTGTPARRQAGERRGFEMASPKAKPV